MYGKKKFYYKAKCSAWNALGDVIKQLFFFFNENKLKILCGPSVCNEFQVKDKSM